LAAPITDPFLLLLKHTHMHHLINLDFNEEYI
jgi:hypothetical protein